MPNFEWAVPASMATEFALHLTQAGARLSISSQRYEPPSEEAEDFALAAFEPLTLIVGTIGATYLIERIVAAVRNVRHGGAVLDARGGTVSIHTNPALPPGMVVGITESGMQVLERADRQSLEELLPAALKRG